MRRFEGPPAKILEIGRRTAQLIYIRMSNNRQENQELFAEPEGFPEICQIEVDPEEVHMALFDQDDGDDDQIISPPESHFTPSPECDPIQDITGQVLTIPMTPELPFDEERGPKSRTKIGQNFASKIKTLVGIVFGTERQKGEKGDKTVKKKNHTVKREFEEYLKAHRATNDQMVLAFLYLFLRKKDVGTGAYREMHAKVGEYLAEKETVRDVSELYLAPDQKEEMAKVGVWKEMNDWLFRPDRVGEPLDLDFLARVCRPLFTGRQQTTIKKRMVELRKIQGSIEVGFCRDCPAQNINNPFRTRC